SRRRHTRFSRDWSSDVCSSNLNEAVATVSNGTITATGAGQTEITVANGDFSTTVTVNVEAVPVTDPEDPVTEPETQKFVVTEDTDRKSVVEGNIGDIQLS